MNALPVIARWLPLVCALLAATGAAHAQPVAAEKLSLAVMDLAVDGAPPELAASLTGLVAAELERLRVFRIISGQDVRAMLKLEAQRQALGCEGDACASQLGNMLGVRYLVSGSLGRVGEQLTVALSMSEVAVSQVVGRAGQSVAGAGELVPAVPGLVRALVGGVLSARQATLLVPCAEAGAVVKVDGQVVGTTPLGRRNIGWGPHLLEVEKAGFVSAIEEFTVQTTGLVERPVTLVPSPDFLETYESGAARMRWGAWLTGGSAVAAAVVAGMFQSSHISVGSRYESGLSDYLAAGRPEADFEALRQLRQDADGALLASRLMAAAAALLVGGTAFFVVAGPDPERYARYRGLAGGGDDVAPENEKPRLDVRPGLFTLAFEVR